MRRRTAGLLAILAVAAAGATTLALRLGARAPGEPVRATLSLASALGAGDTAGFARALAPRPFRFPEDHGPHPAFQTEWWYFTGNLAAPDGRRFGYELTFFRRALAARAPARASDWGARDVYLAHFAITDSAAGRFRATERVERGAAGLAGARAAPWRVWLDDWSAQSADSVAPAFWPIRLVARDSVMALALTLDAGGRPVPEGQGGLSRKGPGPGDASYYYSLPRMPTAGWLEVGGHRYAVQGDSWMDREWSTSALAPDEVGWDWFALQLADGRALMLYLIRRRGGGVSPYSAGTLIGADGSARPLAAADVAVAVLGTWTSPLDGTRYPARWRLRIPSAGLDLDIRPMLADQELNVSVRYWEGAVWLTGSAAGRPVTGRGYVELTGYGARPARSAPSTLGPR